MKAKPQKLNIMLMKSNLLKFMKIKENQELQKWSIIKESHKDLKLTMKYTKQKVHKLITMKEKVMDQKQQKK